MKYLQIILTLFLSFFLLSCNSIPEEKYNKLKEENDLLRAKYSNVYRKLFNLTEYPKLTKFEKQGFHWALDHVCESSGMISEAERERIKKEYGDSALKEWNHGYEIGWDFFLGRYKFKEETSNKKVELTSQPLRGR